MVDTQFVEFGGVSMEELLAEEELLPFDINGTRDSDEALDVFDRAVRLTFNVEEFVVIPEILNH